MLEIRPGRRGESLRAQAVMIAYRQVRGYALNGGVGACLHQGKRPSPKKTSLTKVETCQQKQSNK